MSTTIATMIFTYEGKEYPYEYDFKMHFTKEKAEYMFYDGNYSCDCNRSAWIRAKYGDVMPDLDCGETIGIKNFKIKTLNY